MKRIKFILLFAIIASVGTAFTTPRLDSPCDQGTLYGRTIGGVYIEITSSTHGDCIPQTDFVCKYYKVGNDYFPCPDDQYKNQVWVELP